MTELAPFDPIDFRTFPPVQPLSSIPETWRQTFLSKATECPRSAYLYAKYNGGVLTPPLAGGTLLHRAIERCILHMIENGEVEIAPETAKDILNEILVESTDLTVAPERFDQLRAMMFHFAEGFRVDPNAVMCVETPVEVEINGRRVTGTIDYAESHPREREIVLYDWKSAFHHVFRDPSQEGEAEPMGASDDWMATFQLILYAHAMLTGTIGGLADDLSLYDTFRLRQVHPRNFWERRGTMAYREAVITREALLDWRLYLETVVAAVERAFESWQFPAIVGKHCDFCPASAECPIPAALRDYRGEIRTAEDARRAAVLWEAASRRRTELWNGIKGYAESTGQPVRYGKDLILYWRTIESEPIRDKVAVPGSPKKVKGLVALKSAVMKAVDFGVPFTWEDFYKPSISTRLMRRKLTDNELLAEREREAGGST